jgi:hypothetical protein
VNSENSDLPGASARALIARTSAFFEETVQCRAQAAGGLRGLIPWYEYFRLLERAVDGVLIHAANG